MKRTLLAVSIAGLLAIPLVAQDNPESLLPPGFNDPPPPPKAPSQPPTKSGGEEASEPRSQQPSSRPSSQPSSSPRRQKSSSQGSSSGREDPKDNSQEDEEEEVRYDVPAAARRSLNVIGFIGEDRGGFPVDAYGSKDGEVLSSIIKKTQGPLVSRWGSIVVTRLLASRTQSPDGVKAADWVAERAWLMLRMGQSVNARQLVQQVDAGDYTERLYTVAMQAYLANADLAGFCPHADRASIIVKEDRTWTMARPICASLAGEQAAATSLLNRAKRNRTMVGVDYLLAEKAVGAGTNGRRSVKIEWDKAKGFNAWRHGLANATGVVPPQRYYDESGRHVEGWKALLPMLPVQQRVNASYKAAALGVLSNRAMTDLFAQASGADRIEDLVQQRSEALGKAYALADPKQRVAALSEIWGSAEGDELHGLLVLTARAAAAVEPADYGSANDNLIRSMMTAGFDAQAAGWIDAIDEGSLGYGLLLVGAPGMQGKISYSQLDNFYDDDGSTDSIKSKMLLAGAAGLGRIDAETEADFAEKLEITLSGESAFTRAVSAAARNGESGTVALLTAAGLQGRQWSNIEPRILYHIVKALTDVGREAEARMIAAEAVSFS